MANILTRSNFSGKYGSHYYLEIQYDIIEKNIPGNYTIVRAYAYIGGDSYASASGTAQTVYIEGNAVGSFTKITKNQYVLVGYYDKRVNHDAVGNASTTISAHCNTIWNNLGNASCSSSIALPNIPRTSSVTCTDGYIESAVSININCASDTFTHTLRYTFGSLSGTIATGVGTSYGWTLPSSFYLQIPSATSGTGTIYCDTYSGGTLIGTSSCVFTARTDESKCKPSVSATVVDTNSTTIALTGDSNKLIKGVSNVKITISATAKNSSSITGRSVVCGDGKSGSGTEITLNKVENGSFTVSTTDSRGYANSATITKELINYVPLTMNPNFYRPEPTSGEVALQVSGNYFNGSFGSASNSLTLKYRYKQSGGTYPSTYTTLTATISGNSYSLSLSLGKGFNYQTSYDFEIIATDKLNTITRTIHVSEGIPMLALLKNAIEMFGTNAFTVSNNTLKLNCDLIYPVGSIYMSVNSTSPATLFGGTWEQLQNRFLLGAGSSYSNGSTGGASTVSLNVNQMPSHQHWVEGTTSHASLTGVLGNVFSGATDNKSGIVTQKNIASYRQYSQSSDQTNNWADWVIDASHSHTFGALTNFIGGSQAHENMPPYLVVYMWKRIA